MRSVIIKDFPKYEIFEDRRIRNIKTDRFLVVKGSVYLQNETGSHICSVRKLMQQAGFNTAPQIVGLKHVTINNYPNYQLYDNGQVWDSFLGRWKMFGKGERGHLQVQLTNEQGSTKLWVHRLVYQHFIGPIPAGNEWIIHHRDSCPQHNTPDNLFLTDRSGHTRDHKLGNQYNLNRHPDQKTKNKISNTLKEYNKAHPQTEQQRKAKSERMKKIWAQRKAKEGVI